MPDQTIIATQALLDAASNRGLRSELCVAPPSEAGMMQMFQGLLYEDKVPIIVCQRLSDELALLGHFRVVIGCYGNTVVVHDPIGEKCAEWDASKFFDYLKRTGMAVEGGVCVVISTKPLVTQVSYDQASWRAMQKKIDPKGRIA